MNVIEEASVIGDFQQQQQNAHESEEVSDNEEEEDEDPTRHNLEDEMDKDFIPEDDDANSSSTSSENEDGDGSLETTSDAAMTAANPGMVDFNNDGPLMADHHGDQMMFNNQVNVYNDGYIHGPPQPPPPPMPQQQQPHQYQIENDQLSFAPPMPPQQLPMATMNAPDYNDRPHMFDVGNGNEQDVMYVGANHPHEIIAQHYQHQDNMMNENFAAGQSTPVTTHVKPMMTSKQFISEPYSTPSNNQIPPLNVHGTVIPIPEENFHRKRGTDESASPKYQYQQQQQQNQQEMLNTQTINMENSEANSPQSPRVVGVTNNYIKQHQNGVMIHPKFNPGMGYAAAAARGNQIIDDDRMPVDMSRLKDEERRDLDEFEREQKEQDQFFDIEKYYQPSPSNSDVNTQLYRQYMQLGILYRARGSKLDHVTNSYTAFKDDMDKEIRALKHKISLAQTQQQIAESACANMTENERLFKEELNKMIVQQKKDSETIAKLNFEKQELGKQLENQNMEIESLHRQIQEMQRSETMETERQRFETFTQQLRDQHEAQIHELLQKISTIEIESKNKDKTFKELSDTTAKTSDEYRKLTVVNADLQGELTKAIVEINRLNGLLNQIHSENQKYRAEIDGLMQKCDELESEKTSDSTATMTTSKTVSTIQKEFDAVTKNFREKKLEAHQKQIEIERLQAQIEELGKEKTEQQEELTNLREQCDKALSECEALQNEKANFEEKEQQLTQHIEALEEQLKTSNNYEMNVAMVQQSEQLRRELDMTKAQLAEYETELTNTKCALDDCQREVIKTKELYLAICKEKNNLEDSLRENIKKELEAQFDKRLQVSVEAAIEEIRVEFDLELKKKIAEIESIKQEKAKLQQTFHSTETQYKSRVSELQRTLEEKEAQLNEQLNQLQIQLEEKETKLNQLQKELETVKSTSRTTESELKEKLESAQRSVEQLSTDCERLRGEIESTEKRCQNLQDDCNRLQNSLNEEREKTEKIESELKEVRESETNRSTDELSRLKEDRDGLARLLDVKESEIVEERARLTQLEQKLLRYKDESELHEKKLVEEFDMARKRWQLEKNQLIEKSENDLRVTVDQLENRFNEDYARFMEAHKVKFNDGLMQKNEEFRVEKEKIMEMYQEKFGQYEREQQELFKQIKELKDQLKEAKEFNEKLRKEGERLQKEANDQLTAIREEHEKEVNELRREKEDAARERQDELDANENDRKDSESIEVLYKKKVDDMEAKYEAHINEIQNKFDSDLQRSKIELNDRYKQILTKSKSDIEELDKVAKILKDKLKDSKRVNDNLKTEMLKMKEAHLNELTQLAMKSERDRQSLVEQTEEAVRRVQALKRQLDECDEEYRKQSEIMKAELKADYSYELSKMNKKMNDMMSSHQSAVEILNRQHAERLRKSTSLFNTSVLTIDVSSQTDMVMKDIQKVELFKKNYLENMNVIKGDMLKELDDQTRRFTSKLRRQKNDERLSIRKKILDIFMPKIVGILEEFSISNFLIEARITDLKSDLELITATDDTDTPKPSSSSRRIQSSQTTSNPNNRAHFSSSLGRLTESVESTEPATTTTRTSHRYDDQLSSSTTKRSASVLGSVIRPNLAKSDDFSISNSALNLHSKSASNMVDLDAILSPRSSSKGERRGEDVMAPMSARSRGNIDQVLSSLASSTSTSYSTLNRLKSPLTVATNTVQPVEAYKCSPLRQSWNNLALLSPTFNNSANIDTNHNERRGISEEDDYGGETSRSIASATKINRFVSTGRSRASQTKPVDLEQPTDEEERTSKVSDREDDYIYVDDDENDAADFNKYRAQNIRKKKNSQPKQSSVSDLINSNRAATNLVRTSSNFLPFSSSSTSSTIGNSNGQSVTKIVQRSNTTATGTTVAKKSSSSGLLGGGVNNNGGFGYNSANDTESDDTPTRLPGASSDSSEPESMAGRLAKNRSATTTTVSSQTSNLNNQSKTSANNSLSRERTTSTVSTSSATNSLSKQQQYTSTSSQELPIYSSLSFSSISPAPSFMSATKASMQRTVSNSGSKISNGSSIFSTSSYSTQYHPISSTAAAASTIVKQSIFQKKKNAFH